MFKPNLSPNLVRPMPIPSPRVLPVGKKTEAITLQHARLNEANESVTNKILELPASTYRSKADMDAIPASTHTQPKPVSELIDEHERELESKRQSYLADRLEDDILQSESSDEVGARMHDDNTRLDSLIANDFPFDPSQLSAIDGITTQQYACLTGAAGTGKTTVTKAIVDRLVNADDSQLGEVDMTGYFRKSEPDPDEEQPESKFVPSVAIVAFTGKASQMVKKNFPRPWHQNIMTIHRMLAYYPEFYEDWDDSTQSLKNKMRFVPGYTRDFRLPWDIVIIDEAGMLALDLWENLWAALKPGARVIMIGDINQLPPVHGRSVFGFAMAKWPSWELTQIHRQVGANNSIVDNAWLMLQGKTPKSDSPLPMNWLTKESMIQSLNYIAGDDSWKSVTIQIPDDARLASQRIRQCLKILHSKFYDPIRDTIITAINGLDDSKGYVLGQIPMNRELAILVNHDGQRFIIDAGRERKNFAIGDKVMATKNDHEAGITNGMTGIITDIQRNAAYAGDTNRFGTVEEVAEYLRGNDDDDDDDFTLEEISESIAAQAEGKELGKESKERGPASHIVSIRFGEGDHALDLFFSSLSEVASLMTAYVVTCHKMQGGESPHVFTILHHAHTQMHYREWLYTAWTRASEKAILLYTPLGLRKALNKQKIKGTNLSQKVQAFIKLQGGNEGSNKVWLAESRSLSTSLTASKPRDMSIQHKPLDPALASILGIDSANKPDETVQVEYRSRVIERIIIVELEPAQPEEIVNESDSEVVDAEWHDVVEAAPIGLPNPQRQLDSTPSLSLEHYNPSKWDGQAERHYVYESVHGVSHESKREVQDIQSRPRDSGVILERTETPVLKKSLFANAVTRSK